MPHGGGHGGGFSGGGFSGGGFHGCHHHRHHHHPHHYNFRGPGWAYWWAPHYYYNGSPGYAYRRAYNCACACFWILLAIILVIVIVPSALGTTGDFKNYAYAPGDTRIVEDISETLCSGVSLSRKSTYSSRLYSLSKEPTLSSSSSFSVESRSETVESSDGYLYWGYLMYDGSMFSVNMCIHSTSGSLSLLFIKGRSNFKKWTDNGQERFIHTTNSILASCPSSAPPISFTVPAGQGDDWYIVVYNRGSRFGTFDFVLNVNRTKYTFNSNDIIDSCSPVSRSSCSIPVSSGATYLVQVDPGESPNYEDNVDIRVDCVANGGVIAVIVIVPLLFFAGVIVACIIVLVCIVKMQKRKQVENGTNTAPVGVTAPTGTTVTVTSTVPTQPPVNPEYSSAPPPYTYPATNPPPYSSVEKPAF